MREADGLKGKKMKVYDTMDLPKGKENRGFQAPFSAFSPKFDVLCNSMIECQDTSFPFRPDATFLPKNLLKKRKHHVLPTFEHVSKDPFFAHFIER